MPEEASAAAQAGSETAPAPLTGKARVLVVDDEERFRRSLAGRLTLRGFQVEEAADGEEALRKVRASRPDVVLLDRKLPGMPGETVLREIKRHSPEVQVIVLTGHASIESAAVAGRLEAYAYLEKPCETAHLVAAIEAARREKVMALARQGMAQAESRSLTSWLRGTHGSRPGVILLGTILLALFVLLPPPASLRELLQRPAAAPGAGDPLAGYARRAELAPGESISDAYARLVRRPAPPPEAAEAPATSPEEAARAARAAMVMIGVFGVSVLFWATGALPLGITSLLAVLLMYLFRVFPPDLLAAVCARDAVIFLIGLLALTGAVARTGLDRRVALLLLRLGGRGPASLLFLFCPLVAVAGALMPAHALVALFTPAVALLHTATARSRGGPADRAPAMALILAVTFAANLSGLGSPAAGGGNALAIGLLADYGAAPSFGRWAGAALPAVPFLALVTAGYFYLRFRRHWRGTALDLAAAARQEAEKLGRPARQERIVAVVLALVLLLWLAGGRTLGLGGPALLGLVALAAFRVLGWRDINRIPWDVVALYASACALGAGLASTGASLWLAQGLAAILPPLVAGGAGLWLAASLLGGALTQFMPDGAVVAALAPLTVPLALLSGTHPWAAGMATAFGASLGHCLLAGSPNNAIAFTLARDPDTGEQLVTQSDFLRHGLAAALLGWLALGGWAFLGYWRWIGF